MNRKTAVDVAVFAVSQVVLWYGVRWVIAQMDPMRKKKEESQLQAREIFEKLGRKDVDALTEYEQVIASEIILPSDIRVKFSDIGGLQTVISALREAVIYPLTMPGVFQRGNDLLGPPKGVLLYGPPGCGKTLIAKALASEAGATFINLHVSTLTEKWYGESQKLVRALFSLAKKLQPTVIFIDEIDSFLRERSASDHEVTGMMKAEFMSLWDGLGTTSNDRIMVLGATNRYHDIDKAILRRMPKRFHITLPDEEQRMRILEIMLKDQELSGNRKKLLTQLSVATVGFSGSDLKELCRNAAMLPVREYLRKNAPVGDDVDYSQIDANKAALRPLTMADFLVAAKQEQGANFLNQHPAH